MPFSHLKLESDDFFLKEDGGKLILEGVAEAPSPKTYFQKKFYINIFNKDEHLNAIEVFKKLVLTYPKYTWKINSIPSDYNFRIGAKIDDFSEGDNIDIKKGVQVIVRDKESEKFVLYEGFISEYEKVYERGKEFVNISCLHWGAELSKYVLEDSTDNTEIEYTSTEISDVIKDIIDKYRILNPATKIRYTGTSIDSTGIVITVKMSCVFVMEALLTVLKTAPEGWYWRLDPDGVFHFHNFNKTVAEHTLTLGKQIENISSKTTMLNMNNKTYFIGGNKPLRDIVWTTDIAFPNYGTVEITFSFNDKLYVFMRGVGANAGLYEIDSGNFTAKVLSTNNIYSHAELNGFLYGAGSDGTLDQWDGVSSTTTEVASQLGTETILYNGLVAYNGKIYGGGNTDGTLMEWNGSNAWVEVAPQSGSEVIQSLVVYNNKIYGGTFNGGKLLEWNGTNAWVEKAPQLAETGISSMIVYKNRLYGGTHTNGKLYQWNDSNAWVEVAGSIATSKTILAMVVHNDKLYCSTAGTDAGGLYVWNEANAWIEVAPTTDDFSINEITVYKNKIYAGNIATPPFLFSWEDENIVFYYKKNDITSQNTYGTFANRIIDSRITVKGTANQYCDSELTRWKNPIEVGRLTIMDNNGDNQKRGYDIESLKPGQTIRIKGYSENVFIITTINYEYYKAIIGFADLSLIKETKVRDIDNKISLITTEGIAEKPINLD